MLNMTTVYLTSDGFNEDSAPVLKAEIISAWRLPPQSPDLHPAEHL